MLKIFKYQLNETDQRQKVKLPAGAKILSVQWRWTNLINLWALVNPDNKEEEREFEVIETGKPIQSANRIIIGTVHSTGFSLHVFELLPY